MTIKRPEQLVCNKVSELIPRELPYLLEANSPDSFVEQLLEFPNGEFCESVSKFRNIGMRKSRRAPWKEYFEKNNITPKMIEDRMGCDRATINRFFQGKTASKLEELFLQRFPELIKCPSQKPERIQLDGYVTAIGEIRNRISNGVEIEVEVSVPMTVDTLRCLWTQYTVYEWGRAVESWNEFRADPINLHDSRKAEEKESLLSKLEDAANKVKNGVSDGYTSLFVAFSPKTPSERLIELQEEWGTWFKLVLYGSHEVGPQDRNPN